MNHNVDFQRHRARLSGLEVSDAYLEGEDLRRAVAQSSTWGGCTFKKVRFESAALGNSLFDRCRFEDCDFRGATLVARIYRSTFERCNLDTAILRGAHVLGSRMSGRAQFSDWDEATIENSQIELDLRGADLNFCTTTAVDFSGSNLWSARLPMNCAFFTGNTFDKRQIGMLIALFLDSNSSDELKDQLRPLTVVQEFLPLYDRVAHPTKPRKMAVNQ